jgi:SnoaL-like protein
MELTERSLISRHLEEKVIAYWHDVDFHWGQGAAAHYTEDGLFISPTTRYEGRPQIAEFYAWRRDRGGRVNVHLVGNFFLRTLSAERAEVDWICTLHASDGDAPQPSAPPIAISRVEDVFVLVEGDWLCQRRSWHTLFKGETPTTALSADEMAQRMQRRADS